VPPNREQLHTEFAEALTENGFIAAQAHLPEPASAFTHGWPRRRTEAPDESRAR
jgi:hypothetical protein